MKSEVKFKMFNNLAPVLLAVQNCCTCWTSALDDQTGGQGWISQGPRGTTMARASWVL